MIKKNKKNLIGSILVIFVTLTLLINIIVKDLPKNERENKNLQMFPEFSFDSFFSSSFSSELIDYTKDQFAYKDIYTRVKSYVNYNIFNKKINNGIYKFEDYLAELMISMNESKLELFDSNITMLESIIKKNALSVVIPDKSMYLPDDYLHLDFQDFLDNTDTDVLNIYEILSLESFYKTDLHWNHQGAYDAYEVIIKQLKGEDSIAVDFEKVSKEFFGYYSNKSMDLSIKDDMYIAHNDILDNLEGIYNQDQLLNGDKYNMYLDGNYPVYVIENELATNDDELIIFKDSFGLSIAPFLAMHYSKVTLIDLRITKLQGVYEYLNTDADYLFLYGFKTIQDSQILN